MGQKKRGFFNSLGDAYGALAVVIAVLVAVGATLAYALSVQFREMVSLRDFVVGVVGWVLITVVIWWLGRGSGPHQ